MASKRGTVPLFGSASPPPRPSLKKRDSPSFSARASRKAVVAREAVGGHSAGRSAGGAPGVEVGLGAGSARFAAHLPAQARSEGESGRVREAAVAVALELD